MEQQDNGIDGDFTHQKYYKYIDAIIPPPENMPKKLHKDLLCKFIKNFYSGYKIYLLAGWLFYKIFYINYF